MMNTQKKQLVILGAGGFGSTVLDLAEQLDYQVTQLDDAIPGKELETFQTFDFTNTFFIPAFGDNEFRMKWCNRIEEAGGKLATLIHPLAYVSKKSVIEAGTVILANANVNTNVIVKRGCIINFGAIVDHSCVLEEGCHIGLGAIVKGDNKLRSLTKVEAGRVIENGTFI